MESLEGTALYVEYKAHTQLNPSNDRIILEEYIKSYTDINEENLNIRRSTYSQGLILGLIADVFIPDWKSKFTDSGLLLSDFIRNKLQIKDTDADYIPEDIAAIEKCVNNWVMQRDGVFEDFDRQPRVNRLEEGFKMTGFDPMNVVKRNKEVIHKNFLRIKIGDTDQVIKGPVKAIIGEHMFDVKRIER